MDIFERIMFNRAIKVNQAARRAEVYRDIYGYKDLTAVWINEGSYEVNERKRLLNVPPTYNPIRSDDLPLDEFLKLHPEHRNIEIKGIYRRKKQ